MLGGFQEEKARCVGVVPPRVPPRMSTKCQSIWPIAFWSRLVNPVVIGLDALCALGIVRHRRLRVYIVDTRDRINEVVVGSERMPDQFLHEDAGDVVPFCSLQGGTEQQMQ